MRDWEREKVEINEKKRNIGKERKKINEKLENKGNKRKIRNETKKKGKNDFISKKNERKWLETREVGKKKSLLVE